LLSARDKISYHKRKNISIFNHDGKLN